MARQIPALTADDQSPIHRNGAVREPRLPYQPGLDGLRALAVLAVLLYHADVRWMPGGFLGVEVFFVISGYLITSLLLAEWNVQGSVSLKRFWIRRARRLLPALFLLLGGTLAFAVLFLPDDIASLRADAAAALGYVFNWHLVLSNKSYFEIIGRPSLLQHLWSLGVEEQFYLLWPLLFILAMRLLPRRRVLLAVIAGAAASTLLMAFLFQPEGDPSRVYYGTDTRAAGFLIGAALAFVWSPGRSQHRARHMGTATLDALGLGALVALAGFCIWIDEYQSSLYLGGFAAVALTTMVLIAITVHPRASLVPRLLGGRPLRWIGKRSYAIYLWHWPVYMVTRPQLDVPYEGPLLLGMQLAVILLLADVSYHFVETPIRGGSLGRAWRALREVPGARLGRLRVQWAGLLGFLLAFCIVLGIPIVNAEPPEEPDFLSAQSIDTISIAGAGGPVPEATAQPTSILQPATEAPAVSAAAPSPTPDLVPSVAPPQATPIPSNSATAAPQSTRESTTQAVTTLIIPTLAPQTTPTLQSSSVEGSATEVAQVPAVPTLAGPAVQTVQAPAGWSIQEALTPVDQTPVVRDPVAQAPADRSLQEAMTSIEQLPPSPTIAVQTPTAAPTLEPTTIPQGDVASEAAQPTPASGNPPTPPGRVTAIGDSVMLSAAKDLEKTVANVEIDAKVGRQVADAIKILRAHRDAGQIGPVVIVHLGNNGAFREKQFDEMMQVLSDAQKVVFVNVKVPRHWQDYNNRILAGGVERYPKAVLLDWHAASASQPDLFWKDGYHMRPEGARIYTNLIVTQIQNP